MRQLNPALGPVTEAFVSKLLRLAPEERPESAKALINLLDRFENAQLHAATVANYSWYRHRATRTLPVVLAGIGIAAGAHMNPPGFPEWLLSAMGSWGLAVVAADCFAGAALALGVPGYTARSIRTSAPVRLMLPVPGLIALLGLILLYIFVIPTPIQWILLPGVLALPYAVTEVGWRRAEARSKQARRGMVDLIPSPPILSPH
ncbi:MAG: hypothetical protein ACRDG4_01880 [Chloroflexota bacterium]